MVGTLARLERAAERLSQAEAEGCRGIESGPVAETGFSGCSPTYTAHLNPLETAGSPFLSPASPPRALFSFVLTLKEAC